MAVSVPACTLQYSAGNRRMLSAFFDRIAIIGTGLIGGSWGLALGRAGFRGARVGCDRAEALNKALSAGAIDLAEPDPLLASAKSSLVILATPVTEIIRLLGPLSRTVGENALVTDTGSTKLMICDTARDHFRGDALFLGGHPLAGKENSGVENASPDLFEDAAYLVTPCSPQAESDPRVAAFRELVASLGARVVTMAPTPHDEAMAFLSHLPQLASTALASVIEERETLPTGLAGSGLRDATRLAGSPYDVWRDICSTNVENIGSALDALIKKLQRMREHLGDSALENEFELAQRLRARLRSKS